ncbi:phosphotransferase [Caulobacter segnis]
MVHVCEPDDGLGVRPMSCAAWRARPWAAASSATRPSSPSAQAWRGGVREVLATIHSIPIDGPPPLATSDARGELARYEALYRGNRRPAADPGGGAFRWRWRPVAPPPPERPVLVHGDFRNGNLMIHPERGLVGVLDWGAGPPGRSGRGPGLDPRQFLALRANGEKPVGGFGDYAELLAGHGGDVTLDRASASGRPWAR